MSRTKLQPLLLLLLSALLALAGCGDGDSSKLEEPTGTARQILTFPLTVTIATPNPVAPTKPVIVGSDIVRLGARADVVTGMTVAMGAQGLTTEPDALLNETWSRGPAVLKDRVRVRGTLHAKTRTLGSNVVITTSDLNPAIDPPQTLTWKVSYPAGPENPVTLNSGESQTLDPGKYGVVTLNSNSTLTLKTGTYYLKTLSMQSASIIVKLDQADGPVIIYTTDNLTLRGTFVPLSGTAPPNVALIHLGTAGVFVETLFNGAVVAPSATLTLRSVTGIHTGYFAAKEPVLDAGARVQYRAPAALIGAAKPPAQECQAALAGLVPDTDLFRYCCARLDTSDVDRDGIEDCADGCPSDPLKKAPGPCGCGIPETDIDGDGIPTCVDPCDNDANNVNAGQCGCVRPANLPQDLAASGTSCFDRPCPIVTGTTCNAAGVCGNRSACLPAPNCRYISNGGISYWFCPGPVTQSAAAQACNSKQMHLVRINSVMEDRFIQRYMTGSSWIGANSITSSGVWRWTTPTTNNGDQFWQGAANGSQRNTLFSYWRTGAPATQRCAVIQKDEGRWVDVDCAQALGFVCESPLNIPNKMPTKLPGDQGQPPDGGTCIPETDSGLPPYTDGSTSRLQADYDAAAMGIFDGAARNPPPDGSNNCLDNRDASSLGNYDAGGGCRLLRVGPPDFICSTNQSCAQFGSNLVCRNVQDNENCKPDASHPFENDRDAACIGHARCGVLDCPDVTTSTCQQIEICGPPAVDAGIIMGSDIDASPFNPASIFPNGLPDAGSVGVYNDPPEGTGIHHAWCFMAQEQAIPEAAKSNDTKQGSGGGDQISFRFDPDLIFDANVNPLSLGETNMNIHAAARLVAGVKVNNLFNTGVGFDKDILKIAADLRGERCTLSDDQSAIEVFGFDFSPLLGDYIFNTAEGPIEFLGGLDISEETQACNVAVGDFMVTANRAKKAFRDAQQLLKQYHELKGLKNLATLCKDVMALMPQGVDLVGFPGGIDCPLSEPPEITIRRFLEYYQAPGLGVITQLKDAIAQLQAFTAKIQKVLKKEYDIKLVGVSGSESSTIVSVPFAIGPVPMLLQVDAFYSYGVTGYLGYGFNFEWDPFQDTVGVEKKVAHVKAGVMPYANAGLSAFVGAGGGLGGFSATLGVEGSLSLAELRVPIFAGAGLWAKVLEDIRPFEAGLEPPVSYAVQASPLEPLTHFGLPKAFKFNVWFDYGASVDATNVLAGRLSATLRIKFFFFSRTWRKEIAKYNGFSFHRELVGGVVGGDPSGAVHTDKEAIEGEPDGGAADKVTGRVDMGLAETKTQLAILQPVELPDAAVNLPVEHFDAAAIEHPFYDNQCCARPTDPPPADPFKDACHVAGNPTGINAPPDCCPGFVCAARNGPDVGTRCHPICGGFEANCVTDTECCNGLICLSDNGGCSTCRTASGFCGDDHDCCPGLTCGPPDSAGTRVCN